MPSLFSLSLGEHKKHPKLAESIKYALAFPQVLKHKKSKKQSILQAVTFNGRISWSLVFYFRASNLKNKKAAVCKQCAGCYINAIKEIHKLLEWFLKMMN